MKVQMIAVVCLAACALGACGSSGGSKGNARINTSPTTPAPGNGSQGSAKACNLVTQSDANSLFGMTAAQTPDVTGGVGASSTCIWKAETNPGSGTSDVSYLLQTRVYPNTNYYSEAFAQTGTKVSGIGDKAFVRLAGSLLTLTYVKNRQTVAIAYSINGFGTSHPDVQSQQDKLVGIGKQAAGRM